VPDGSLQQRTAQQLAGDRQFAGQLVAHANGLLTKHKNESVVTPAVNPNPATSCDLADFEIPPDSSVATSCSNFAPESS
jgi:hypothetical protein